MSKTTVQDWLIKGSAAHTRLIESKKRIAKSIVRVLESQTEVLFPYVAPYDCQVKMIESVLACIEQQKNGLIESPTGTGKTLSIICAAVAALQKSRLEYRANQNITPISKIIFCTRTHSQIEQIFSEIKSKLPYQLNVSPFASRKHSCIFEDLPERFPGNALNLSCRLLRKLNTIQTKVDPRAILKLQKIEQAPQNPALPLKDIEEITIMKTGCPFFYGYQKEEDTGSNSYRGRQDKTMQKQDDLGNFVSAKIPWEVPLSVSDYHKIGQINNFCPYYLMRDRLKDADLCILPYNYVLDAELREQINLDLTDAVLIFDEGHNIESHCEELFQFDLSVNDLFMSYNILNQVWIELQAEEQFLTDYQRHQVKGQRIDTKACAVFVLKIIDVLESYNLEREDNKITNSQFPSHIHVYRLPELFSLLALVFGKLKDEKDFLMNSIKARQFTYSDGSHIKLNETDALIDRQEEICFRDKISLFITVLEQCITETGDKAKALNKLHGALIKTRVAYDHYSLRLGDDINDDKNAYYDFYVCIMDDEFVSAQANKRRLGVWCFNPSFCFKKIIETKPRSVIFASGTLAPLHAYASELDQEFPIRLENDHVIDKKKQVMVSILTHDLMDREINFSYKSREDASFYINFANTLLRVFKQIKGGVLIFVPAYSMLNKMKKVWRQQKMFKELSRDREVFMEDQNQVKNQAMLQQYLSTIQTQGKAAFFAVCRGKLAEGIDFTDDAARCVIMAGIPYPQVYDPKVLIKKEYLDQRHRVGNSMLNGQSWYRLQAQRAVNQAIGRVIRHVGDYGAIILMDERYRSNNVEISKWLNDCKKMYRKVEDLEQDLGAFFKSNAPDWRPTASLPVKMTTFLKKRNIKSKNDQEGPFQIKYEFDTSASSENKTIKDQQSISNTFDGFQKQTTLQNSKLNRFLRDKDEGESYVESLSFADNKTDQSPIKMKSPISNLSTVKYQRKPYKRQKKE